MEDWFNKVLATFNGQELKGELAAEETKKEIQLTRKDEDSIDTYFMALAAKERYQEILEASVQAINRKPLDAQLRSWYGYALMNLYQYEQAVEILRGALVIDPDYMPARGNLADAYLNNSQYDEAIEEIEKFLKKYPFCTDALSTLGLAYIGQHKYDLAERTFRQILKRQPEDMDAATNLVLCLNEQGATSLDEDDDNFEEEVSKLMSIWRLENEVFKSL
jgi:tetratricopeptide (TPR) repeat protein